MEGKLAMYGSFVMAEYEKKSEQYMTVMSWQSMEGETLAMYDVMSWHSMEVKRLAMYESYVLTQYGR